MRARMMERRLFTTTLLATGLFFSASRAHADDTSWSPKAGADPAPIPAPSTPPRPPTSTSRTQLVPEGTSPPPPPMTLPVDTAHDNAQDARAQALETRLAAAEAHIEALEAHIGWLRNLHIRGYVQPQILIQSFNTAASPNATNGVLPAGIGPNDTIAKADGTTTNGTFFRIRRARFLAEFTPSDYARAVFEIDPNLSGAAVAGTGTIARNVEATGIVPITPDIVTEYSMGIFKLPFGWEIPQSDADRPFIERSWGEQNMFPAEFDTGARVKALSTRYRFNAQLALVNGITIGEKAFAVVPDLNRGKDVVGRVNYDFGPADVGLSGYYGEGQNVDATNLRFKQFPRWATNIEAALHYTFFPTVGMTKVFAELVFAQNMDRGTKYSFAVPQIPAVITDKAQCGGAANTYCDERSFFVRLEQDITKWATAGFRFDTYSPDTAQQSDSRNTFSFLGVAHITNGLQFMAEYDYAVDDVHKAGAPAAGKKIHIGSGVLQGRF
jgi:hypothetical protein